jgi:DNA-binding response OmpR family regulator
VVHAAIADAATTSVGAGPMIWNARGGKLLLRLRLDRHSRSKAERGFNTSPVLVFASSDEWMGRSIGSVFEDRGFSVVRAASGTLALNLARRTRPDVVLLDDAPGGLDAVSVCRALRDDPFFDPSTPIIITSSAHLGSSTRTDAYEAGAWEYCSQPVDIEQLLLKIRTFLRARLELNHARAQRCIDATTGLYTMYGMEQVAYQLRARAARERESVTCLAIGLAGGAEESADGGDVRDGEEHIADVANICQLYSRKSDFIGRAGPSRIAILAPDTGASGARAMVARLQRGLDDASRTGVIDGARRLRAGYYCVADAAGAKLEPANMIGRAATALDRLQQSDSPDPVMGFEDLMNA